MVREIEGDYYVIKAKKTQYISIITVNHIFIDLNLKYHKEDVPNGDKWQEK